jgi:hypothetical protein
MKLNVLNSPLEFDIPCIEFTTEKGLLRSASDRAFGLAYNPTVRKEAGRIGAVELHVFLRGTAWLNSVESSIRSGRSSNRVKRGYSALNKASNSC